MKSVFTFKGKPIDLIYGKDFYELKVKESNNNIILYFRVLKKNYNLLYKWDIIKDRKCDIDFTRRYINNVGTRYYLTNIELAKD